MDGVMNFQESPKLAPFLFVLIAAAAVFAASPATLSAHASACGKWGKTNPEKLSNPQARKAVMCLINRERDDHGLGDLDRNRKLQKAAQRHNERMHGTGCFSHQCPGEPDLGRRLERVGYLGGGLSRWAYGENVAWGSGDRGTPRSIVTAWMNSPGHRAAILSRDFKELGVGFNDGTPGSKGSEGGIFTVDFGLRAG